MVLRLNSSIEKLGRWISVSHYISFTNSRCSFSAFSFFSRFNRRRLVKVVILVQTHRASDSFLAIFSFIFLTFSRPKYPLHTFYIFSIDFSMVCSPRSLAVSLIESFLPDQSVNLSDLTFSELIFWCFMHSVIL